MNAPPAAKAPPDAGPLSIHAHRLTRIYRVGSVQVTGIDGIDLSVPSGQFVVLKGDSGSGKSTLLSLLAGLDCLTAGELTVDGTRHEVQGSAWMDHEFSTAPLQPGITGWDWFSLQLSDRTEIMIFLLRQPDGTLNPASSGTVVLPSGQTRHLPHGGVRIEPLSFWTSPHSGARYPVKWKVAIATRQLALTVTANLDDQEMRTPRSTNLVYWEGSVQAEGTHNEKAIDGVGYVELTGYAQPFDAPM